MTVSAVLILKFVFPAFAETCRGDLCSLGPQLPSERRRSQRSLCSEVMLVLAAWLGIVGGGGRERDTGKGAGLVSPMEAGRLWKGQTGLPDGAVDSLWMGRDDPGAQGCPCAAVC